MRIGLAEIHLVSDGIAWLDGGGTFGLVPRATWEKHLAPDEFNRIPLGLHCLLIHSEGKTILVDTGLGDHLNEKTRQIFGLTRTNGGLIENLARLNVKPEAVDVVINTHLHIDHCGGNTARRNEGEERFPTFTNAEYWIQRLELADASFPNERTRTVYLAQNFLPLQEKGQLRLLNGDTRVTNEVWTVTTRGHTRAHQSVVINSEGKTALFTGDLTTLAIQLGRLAWVTAYDVEPLETIETKRHWQQWALEREALIIPAHDTQTPMVRLREDTEGKLRLEPISPDPTQQLPS